MKLYEQTNRIKQMMGILTEASKKDILVNKFGLREDIAQGLYELCGPLTVWMFNKLIDYQNYIWKSYDEPEKPKIDVVKYFNNEDESRILKHSWRERIVSIMDYIRVSLNGDISTIKDLSFIELYKKAEDWHDSLEIKGGDINYIEKNPILIDFGDGYYWANLQTNDSREECNRMGHCGRTSYGNNIYSLRHNVTLPGGKYSINKSVLTASISTNGIIYQLKGPKNSKPEEKYFKYILPLFELKNPDGDEYLIRYIGREYGHERDFKITDLPEKDIITLLQNRPDLISNENVDLINDFTENHPEYLTIIYDANPEVFNPENSESLILWNKPEKYPKLIKKIYEDYPEVFESIKLKYTLFKIGLINEDPINWVADVTIEPDDVDDYVNGGWIVGKRKTTYGGTRNIYVFEAMLVGDTWDLYESYDVDWKSSLEYYVDGENERKIYEILKKLNPDVEFDSDMDLEELIKEYDDDNTIRNAISNATESCEADDYVNKLEKELKSCLEEYGDVLNMSDEGVTIRVNLKIIYNKLYDSDYFWEYMENCNYDSKCVFKESVMGGDIDKPDFSIDDRWYPDVDRKLFNERLNDNLGEYL